MEEKPLGKDWDIYKGEQVWQVWWLRLSLFSVLQVKQQENPEAPNVPQPDNAEQRLKLLERKEESCLALATNLWETGSVWNDIACSHQKEGTCEDSDQMLEQDGLA